MMFQMRSQKLKSSVPNSLQKKTTKNSKNNSKKLVNTMLRFLLNLKPKKKKKRLQKMKLKNHKPRRNNETDGLYVFTLSINNLFLVYKI